MLLDSRPRRDVDPMTSSPNQQKHISIDGVLAVLLVSALAFNLYCIMASVFGSPGR